MMRIKSASALIQWVSRVIRLWYLPGFLLLSVKQGHALCAAKLLFADVAYLSHAGQYEVSPVKQALFAGISRTWKERGESSGLLKIEIGSRLGEVMPRGCLSPVNAGAPFYHIEVDLKDPFFRERLL